MKNSYGIQVANVFVVLVASSVSLVACSDDSANTSSTGSVQIIVVPEDTIPEGLKPGADPENLKDGWTVTYDRYLISLGRIRASRSASASDAKNDDTSYVLDLKNAPKDGYLLATWTDLKAAEWDKFGFELPNATAGAKGLAPTRDSDVAFMVQNSYSIYFEGNVDNGSNKIAFKWGFSAGTAFANCSDEQGKPGFAVPSGGTVQVKPTIHGDHWFFTNVTEGAEVTERRASWMKDCNKDGDGELTLAELRVCKAADAFPSPAYNLTGVADQDGDGVISAYDYVESQVRTLGDYQGDGECPTRTRL